MVIQSEEMTMIREVRDRLSENNILLTPEQRIEQSKNTIERYRGMFDPAKIIIREPGTRQKINAWEA